MFAATVQKDTHLLMRDRGAIIGLTLLPIAFVVMFGMVLGERDPSPRAIAVYAAPDNSRAKVAARALASSGAFSVARFESEAALRTSLERGDQKVGVLFPSSFDPAAGKPAVLFLDTARSPAYRAPIEGAVRAAVGQSMWSGQMTSPPNLLSVERRPGLAASVDRVDGFQLSVPGNAVLFCMFLAVTVALSFVEERRTGTWRRLLAAPVHRPLLVFAKMLPYVVVGVLQMSLLFAVGIFGFGMEVGGSYVALLSLTVAVSICAVCLGLLMAAIARTPKQVGGIGSLVLLVMGLIGGCMFPRIAMPEIMQSVGLAVPHGWALDGYYDVLMHQGTTVVDVAPQIGALLGFAVALAAVGAALFRFERV